MNTKSTRHVVLDGHLAPTPERHPAPAATTAYPAVAYCTTDHAASMVLARVSEVLEYPEPGSEYDGLLLAELVHAHGDVEVRILAAEDVFLHPSGVQALYSAVEWGIGKVPA